MFLNICTKFQYLFLRVYFSKLLLQLDISIRLLYYSIIVDRGLLYLVFVLRLVLETYRVFVLGKVFLWVYNVAPLSNPTRLADPNRFRDACLIIFIYILLNILFQKCRFPNPLPDPNSGSELEPNLLRPFSFIISKHFYLCYFILDSSITWKHFKW